MLSGHLNVYFLNIETIPPIIIISNDVASVIGAYKYAHIFQLIWLDKDFFALTKAANPSLSDLEIIDATLIIVRTIKITPVMRYV